MLDDADTHDHLALLHLCIMKELVRRLMMGHYCIVVGQNHLSKTHPGPVSGGVQRLQPNNQEYKYYDSHQSETFDKFNMHSAYKTVVV